MVSWVTFSNSLRHGRAYLQGVLADSHGCTYLARKLTNQVVAQRPCNYCPRCAPPKMDSTRTFLLVVCAIYLALSSLAEGKKGRKLEETESFDVKPSGQLSHQRIDLVSTICIKLGGCTAINGGKSACSHPGKWSHMFIHICSCWRN